MPDGTNVPHSQHVLVRPLASAPTTATRALMAVCGSGRPCSLLLSLASLPAQLDLAALVLYIIATGYLHPAIPPVLSSSSSIHRHSPSSSFRVLALLKVPYILIPLPVPALHCTFPANTPLTTGLLHFATSKLQKSQKPFPIERRSAPEPINQIARCWWRIPLLYSDHSRASRQGKYRSTVPPTEETTVPLQKQSTVLYVQSD